MGAVQQGGGCEHRLGIPPPHLLFACLIVCKEGVTRTACTKKGGRINRKVDDVFLQHRPRIHSPDTDTICKKRSLLATSNSDPSKMQPFKLHAWSFIVLDAALLENW